MVRVTPDEAGPGLRFEVTDSGIGIDSTLTDRIFDPFGQGDSSTTRRYGGTGLGLTISKRIIELMGGQIGVRSTPGQGSTFWFTVDVIVLADEHAPTVPLGVDDVLTLIVDDNDTSRSLLQQQLRGWGMSATVAADGHSALHALRSAAQSGHPHTLVIIDSGMPEMTGIELVQLIRADARLAAAHLLMLNLPGSGRAAAVRAGVDGFVTKPVRPALLRDEITRVVSNAPRAPSGPRDPAQRQRSAGPPVGFPDRPAVLVVDDVPVNQQLARRLLEKRGCRVDLARDGRQALERHAGGRYEIIFMDCQMPELDGYQATAEIRRREGVSAHTPIIAMTAHTMQGDRDRCLAAGMDDYIPKPLDPALLDGFLTRTLDAPPQSPESSPGALAAAPVGNAESSPVFDRARLADTCDDDQQFRREVIDSFLDHTGRCVPELGRYLQQGDLAAVLQAAHQLTGTAGLVGAVRLAAFTQRLCEEITLDHALTPGDHQAELKSIYASTVNALRNAR